MLHQVKDAGFRKDALTLLGWRWAFAAGPRTISSARFRTRLAGQLATGAHGEPVAFLASHGRTYWAFEGCFYWSEEECTAQDVLALVRDRERRRRRKLDRAHAALAGESTPARREPLVREVRLAVWQRDGGRCADCAADFDLQYDHVIPVAMGGATSVANLQLLCGDCNRRKGAALG